MIKLILMTVCYSRPVKVNVYSRLTHNQDVQILLVQHLQGQVHYS